MASAKVRTQEFQSHSTTSANCQYTDTLLISNARKEYKTTALHLFNDLHCKLLMRYAMFGCACIVLFISCNKHVHMTKDIFLEEL